METTGTADIDEAQLFAKLIEISPQRDLRPALLIYFIS